MPPSRKTETAEAERAEAGIASAADAASDAITITQQDALQTLEVTTTAVVEGVTRFQREIIDFVSDRIRQDIETQQELLRCRSLDEVRDVQTRFFQMAMDQYSNEASKLMRLGSEILERSLNHRAG